MKRRSFAQGLAESLILLVIAAACSGVNRSSLHRRAPERLDVVQDYAFHLKFELDLDTLDAAYGTEQGIRPSASLLAT